MKMITLLSLLALMIGHEVFADPAKTLPKDVGEICKTANEAVTQRIFLKAVPSYFAKVYTTKKFGTVILDGQNWIINLDNGKSTQVYGDIDPVPTPDEKFLVSINTDDKNLVWTTTKDIVDTWEGKDFPERWGADNFNPSFAYQSLGFKGYKASTQTRTYRLLTDDDHGSIYFKDVHFRYASENDDRPKKTEDAWVKLCTNIPGTLKLPVISKDGSKLSAYNISKNRTEIFNVQDNGNCTDEKPLPWATGKADFSFDGEKVTFHMGKFPEPKGWFEYDNPRYKLDVYVLDMKKNELTKVTDTGDGDSYFPSFRRDGTIGFIEAHHKPGGKLYYYISLADPAKGHKMSEELLTDDCNCNVKPFAQLVAIGALREQLCSNLAKGMTLEHSAVTVLALDKNKCEKMVKGYWDKLHGTVAAKVKTLNSPRAGETDKVTQLVNEMPMAALLAACPQELGQNHEVIEGTAALNAPNLTPDKAVKNTCSSCHAGVNPSSGHSFDFADISKLSSATRTLMAEKIRDEKMPPGGIPDPAERKKIADYLTTLKIPLAGH
jgi:hypothetical protein